MGQKPAELTPDASPWHWWGAELRRSREARNLSLEDLGRRIWVSRSYLSKLERAERAVPREMAVKCDEALDLAGSLVRSWEQAACARQRRFGPVGEHVDVSSPGSDVSNMVPDLASVPFTAGSSEDDQITAPCRLRDGRIVFMSVPRRTFLLGGAGAAALAAAGGVTLSLSPAAASASARIRARAAASGLTPVEHLRRVRRLLIDNDNLLGPRRVISTVYEQIKVIQALRRESTGSDHRNLIELQTQFAEFAAWLHQDVGEFRQSGYWLDRALQWSHLAADPDLTCFVMARKSQLAAETHETAEVVDLAEAAQSMTRPGTRLATVGRTYEAVGHALRGEASASIRAFDEARLAIDNLSQDPSPWAAWLDVSYVEVHRAQGLDTLGEHARSAEVFASAIAQLPEGYYRDRGVYLAREAVAHAGAGEPERAASAGSQSLQIASDTGSGRIFRELARLDPMMQPWETLPSVAEFRTAFDGVILHETRNRT